MTRSRVATRIVRLGLEQINISAFVRFEPTTSYGMVRASHRDATLCALWRRGMTYNSGGRR
ncbi:MAG TPA: hypothetical protein VID48_13485 [Solirubrobacteraceae bacterium]